MKQSKLLKAMLNRAGLVFSPNRSSHCRDSQAAMLTGFSRLSGTAGHWSQWMDYHCVTLLNRHALFNLNPFKGDSELRDGFKQFEA